MKSLIFIFTKKQFKMTFLLGTENALEYLVKLGFCTYEEQSFGRIEPMICKNFNLLVNLPHDRQLLIKQEPHDRAGMTQGELAKEWRIHELFHHFPRLAGLRSNISEAINYDASHSIIVINYLNNYCDLANFYGEQPVFPTLIATALGRLLATIHRATWHQSEYRDFLAQHSADAIDRIPNYLSGLVVIKPEIFAEVTTDGLNFFTLFQRHQHLTQAIAELNQAFQPTCLTHNDLKLNNILWHVPRANSLSLTDSPEPLVRIIDWEKWSWGDPAADLGTLLGSYLKIWLSSMVIDPEIDIETALELAVTPLELVQPSMVEMVRAYSQQFPEIWVERPDFLTRVVQFTGLALIERIRSTIYYHEPFDNISIAMLQVAKTLLCNPDLSTPIIFGMDAEELNLIPALVR
jgi:Phosphotransferase enzyme family